MSKHRLALALFVLVLGYFGWHFLRAQGPAGIVTIVLAVLGIVGAWLLVLYVAGDWWPPRRITRYDPETFERIKDEPWWMEASE